MRQAVIIGKRINRGLAVSLGRMGFEQETRYMFRMPLSSTMTGVVTFPLRLWSNIRWDLSPNVGVRHETLNKLLYSLSELPESDRRHELRRPNLLTNIGYLTSEHHFKT